MSLLNRNRESEPHLKVDDINDHIVQDSMSSVAADPLNSAQREHISSVDVSDAIILEGDAVETEIPKKRFGPKQIIILSLTAVVAVGGVASFFVPHNKQTSPAQAVQTTAPAPQPTEISLPPGLSFVDKSPAAPTPAPVPGPVSSSDLGGKIEATNSSTPASAVVSPESASVTSSAAPAPQAETAKQAPMNPVLAQVEEAKKLTPAPASESASNVAKKTPVVPKVAETASTPKVTPKPAEPKSEAQTAPRTEKTPQTANPAKNSIPVEQTQPLPKTTAENTTNSKSAMPTSTRKSAQMVEKGMKDESEEIIKALVTTTAESFGLQSIQEGSITLERNRGASSERLTVGDRLPSGEQILRIDARSMTLVTDRSVIRFK